MRHIILAVNGSMHRAGLKSLFENESWRVTGEFQNRHQLLPELKSLIEPLVILSEEFCGTGSKSLIRNIKMQCPRARIILWCFTASHAVDHYLSEEAVDGYLYQHCSDRDWLNACLQVHLGGHYTSPYLAQTFRYLAKKPQENSVIARLSKRERLVFQLICGGNTVAEISERLFISRKTVNTFRYRLFKKTNVQNDVQLAHLAISAGLVAVTPNRHEQGLIAVHE